MSKPVIVSWINDNTDSLSHKNLLDNGWFIVNTRNKTTYSSEYGFDRWKCWNITKNDGGISVSQGARIQQIIDNDILSEANGKDITFSVLYSNNVESVVYENFSISSTSVTKNTTCAQFIIQNNILIIQFNLACVVRAVKMEIGKFETLSIDSMPKYEEASRECFQSLADDDDEYTQYTIDTNISNHNILNNSYFLLNDRNLTTVTNAYGVNRWYGTYTINNGLVIKNGYIQQYIDSSVSSTILNKLITISLIGTTNISFVCKAANNANNTVYSDGNVSIAINYSSGKFLLKISATNYTLTHIKLEYGVVSTISNDVCNNLEIDRLLCYTSSADSLDTYANFKSSTNSKFIRFTIPVADWTDGIYTFDSSLDMYNIEVSLDPDASGAQALQYAEGLFTGSPDSNTIKCFGKTPTSDLQVYLKLEAK